MPDPARSLDGVSAILSTIAPNSGQDPVLRLHANDLAGFAGWLGYLSATSVYTDNPDGICYEDTKPASQCDVVRHAAALLGVDAPVAQRLDEVELSQLARSFYSARRHIGLRMVKPELGVDPLYPDYQSGLAAILQADKQTVNRSTDQACLPHSVLPLPPAIAV